MAEPLGRMPAAGRMARCYQLPELFGRAGAPVPSVAAVRRVEGLCASCPLREACAAYAKARTVRGVFAGCWHEASRSWSLLDLHDRLAQLAERRTA